MEEEVSQELKDEMVKIRLDPYNYVLNWADKNLLHVGKQVFKIAALMPGSLYLPKIAFGSNSMRCNISNFVLGEPGDGKTSSGKSLALLSYNPLIRREITAADLIKEMSELKIATIIIDDLSQVANKDYSIIKVLEGIIEEGKLNKTTLNNSYTEDVRGVAFLGVTPQDLEKFLEELEAGLLSRCIVTLIKLTHEQRKEITEFVTLKASDREYEKEIRLLESTVVLYYEELREIQNGTHEEFLIKKFGKNHNIKIINPIVGYDIKMEYKKHLLKEWNEVQDKLRLNVQGKHLSIRETQEYYRLLINLAYLNIHNRNSTDGILLPNDSDHNLALKMTMENMRYKWALPIALNYNKKAKTFEMFEKVISGGIPPFVANIMKYSSPFGKMVK